MNFKVFSWNKFIQIYFLSFGLMMTSLPTKTYALAIDTTKVEELIGLQNMLTGTGATELTKRNGEQVAKKVQEFMGNPANKAVMKTPQGKVLLDQHTRLVNFLKVNKTLGECEQKDEDIRNRQLRGRITELTFLAKTCVIGNDSILSFPTLDELNASIKQITSEIEGTDKGPSDFQDKLMDRSQENSLDTLVSFLHRYHPVFGKIPSNINNDVSRVLQKVCPKTESCTRAEKEQFKTRIKDLMAKHAKQGPKANLSDVTNQINNKIDKLNELLKKIPLKTEGGSFKTPVWDTSDAKLDDQATKDGFAKYVQGYLSEATTGHGNLLLTEAVKDESGGLRSLSDEDMNEETKYFGTTKFTFKKHEHIELADIKKGVDEVEEKVNDQLEYLAKMKTDKNTAQARLERLTNRKFIAKNAYDNQRKKDLKDLIKSNPAAVGEVLIQYPEYAQYVCSLIQGVEKDDKTDDKWDSAWMWGGLIVGGALALTGIGAGVGAWMIAGSASAATMATVATGSFVAATVAGAVEGSYWGKRSFDFNSEINQFEQAFLTGNSDAHSITEAKETLTKFKDARLNAILALGFSAVDMGALNAVGKLGKVTANGVSAASKLDPNQVKSLTRLYDFATDNRYVQKFQDTLKLMGQGGARKLDDFFTYLAQVSESSRIKLLKKIETGKWTPEKMKEVIQEALAAAEKCQI